MHELLIVAPEDWAGSVEPFLSYKRDTGISAKMVSVEDIESSAPTGDLPAKLKRYIEGQVRLDGTRYVLLAGDVDRCPVRYVRAINTEWGTKWYPSDLYYADLYNSSGQFDDWNFDGDGLLGEVDFSGGGNFKATNLDRINMIPDVAVGRVPASSEDELETYFGKVRGYEFAASESYWHRYGSEWFKRCLSVVDGGTSPFGSGGLADQYVQPLERAGVAIKRMYQDEAPWSSMSSAQRATALVDELNVGAGFALYYGHAFTNSLAGWFGSSNIASLANEGRLPLVVAIGCYPARFHFDLNSYEALNGGDWTGSGNNLSSRPEPSPIMPQKHDRDSLAEDLLVKQDAGAIAMIGAVSKFEHGGKALVAYLFEEYESAKKPPALGDLWREAQRRFAQTDAQQGMGGYYAFIHIHKVMLFGDPSLRLGGIPQRSTPTHAALDVTSLAPAL